MKEVMNLYVVHDNVAGMSSFLHEAVNDGVALRDYNKFLANKEKNGEDPKDFTLLRIGMLDHEKNIIVQETPLEVKPSFEIVEEEEVLNG